MRRITCKRCGHDLVPFGEPDIAGMVSMICPASPICPDDVVMHEDAVNEADEDGTAPPTAPPPSADDL